MPGNKFGVGELWDGIKKAVADAWNEVSQKFTGLLKEIGDLVRKNLPAINLILKIVLNLPPLIKSVLELVKQIPKLITGINKLIWKIPGEIVKLLRQPLKALQNAFTTGMKNLDGGLKRAFSAAIKPLPKNIQNGFKDLLKPLYTILKGGFKEIGKIPGEVKKLGTSFSKELGKIQTGIGKQVSSSIGGVTKAVTGLAGKFDKGLLSVREYLFKAVNTAQGKALQATTKLGTDIKSFSTAEFKRMGSRVDTIITEGKTASKSAQTAVKSIGELPGKTQALLVKTRSEVVADLNKLLAKQITEFNKASLSAAAGVEKNLVKVGAEVASSAEAAKGLGRFISEALPMIKSMAKIAINAAPIIDGFADYMQFEELNAKLDILIRRQEYQTEALSSIGIAAKTITNKIEKLSPGGSGSDNRELLSAIRSELNGLATKLAPSSPAASAASIAQEVVSRLPANKPAETEAIAQAVAAKLPKGASAESIAVAVAAKLPDGTKAATATEIATAVKAKLDPSFQTIDKKLPDNGIYRVDQAGIATAVKAKLDPSLQTIDKKLPDNGLFPVDKAGIANTVKSTLDPKLTAIENKIGQPGNSNSTQLQPIVQQIAGLGQQINSLTSAPFSSLQRAYLNDQFGALARINRGTADSLSAQLSQIPSSKVDLNPVLKAVDDVSNALGVPQLKKGLSFSPNAEFLKIGQNLNNGTSATTVSNLPQMMMALAAIPYVRAGHHRLGGEFDKSVMVPNLGKQKITDALGFQEWTFRQVDERMGLPSSHLITNTDGQIQTKSFKNIQDAIEEGNALNIAAGQDLEVVERYLFALTQDQQKLMQIALQTREDVDLVIDDLGCKFKETKRSHPTHISLKGPSQQGSLESLFKRGEVHYVARTWDDKADKNQKLEAISYDTQIAAMSNKFDLPKTNPSLPLDKSRATAKTQNDESWRTFVSTMEEPPEGYISKGNPTPAIKEIKNGTATNVPKPTIPTKKLGK